MHETDGNFIRFFVREYVKCCMNSVEYKSTIGS